MDLIIALIAIMIYVYFFKRNMFKTSKSIGELGESWVKLELSKLSIEYQVQNDIHLNSSQIDHMVFYYDIIFVIETKYWGNTSGSCNDKYWTNNGRQMYNPILQNRRHCSNVKKTYPSHKIINVVVFTNKHNFPHSKNVIHVSKLIQFIKDRSV